MKTRLNRRHFLAGAAGGTGLLIVPARTAFTYQANERLNLALVGAYGYCNAAVFTKSIHTFENASITTLCDVDDRKLANVYKLWDERARDWPSSSNDEEKRGAPVYQRLIASGTKPPLYRDFRKMLEERDREIDAVVCATPDHTHSIVSAHSLRAGKHIFAEKPLTLRMGEGRALRKLAAERPKLATSMGNQGTQTLQFRRGVELIREGVLGPVEQVHIWFSRGGADLRQPPEGEEVIPPELHWDLWLGPVASRPYNRRWIARNNWRDTTIGELGNFAPHTANMAFMGLNIRDLWQTGAGAATRPPIRVQAEVPNINLLSFPRWERIQWKVPARGAMPPVTIHWYQGGPVPNFGPGDREKLQAMVRDLGGTPEQIEKLMGNTGCLVIGSKGALITDSHNTRFALLPEGKFRDVPQDRPKTLPVSLGHYKDWMAACRGGEMPLANFGYAATFLEFLDLGDLATRFSPAELAYDPAAGKILNHAEANQRVDPGYRQGWTL